MDDYHKFIELIRNKTGIDLASYKEVQMRRRLTSLCNNRGFTDFTTYYKALITDNTLLNEFLDRITINVSEFYRNYKRWEVFETKILPNLLKDKRKINVWSAACSTGEEPYTIAIILNKYMDKSNINILATDIDENILVKAKEGIYAERALQEVPKVIKNEHFTQQGTFYKINESIKKCVTFQKHNLLSDTYPTNYDLIVCRNVLIYFTEEAKNKIYHNFSQSLADKGVLFVGSTEQIFNPSLYNLEVVDTFFYQKTNR